MQATGKGKAMSINFIPNDPRAGRTAPAMRPKAPSATRPRSRSGFVFGNTSPEAVAAPGTPQFLFWQAREAAILTLRAFEGATGSAHTRWQGARSKLPLVQDAGIDVNAFYDRASFSFFHQTVGSRTFFSGASTDVVSHEVGHGLLDSLRPDFFSVNFLEVGAVHEAFGDCMAILTALSDRDTRVKLLRASTTLRRRNFVESWGEELSFAIGLVAPGHNASVPRRTFNRLRHQIPSTLPTNGGPGALINEVHSFGMIFSGCFWDLTVELFNAAPARSEAALLSAARLAARLTIAGAARAVITPRFMQSMGRAMTLADQSLHRGVNRAAIGAAFARHGILLGTNAMLAPAVALAGQAPSKGRLGAAARQDLMRHLGAPRGARLDLQAVTLDGAEAVSAVHTRSVPLSGLHPLLKGVVALAPEPVMVGRSGTRAAVMGALPNPTDTVTEVHAFVESLLAHRRLLLPGSGPGSAPAREHPQHATHAIRSVGGKKVLTRVRFACACHPLRANGGAARV